VTGDVALVMSRELRERLRSRFYLLGTVVILLVVGAAIVIPVIHHSKATTETIGVVGTLSPATESWLVTTARAGAVSVNFVVLPGVTQVSSRLASGRIDFAVVNGRELIVETQFSPNNVSTTASVASALAARLGTENALAAAHLSVQQAATLAKAGPVPIKALHRGTTRSVNATSLIGVILIFIMLSQYNTWILIGVMEEKSSRVIEVLLSTVRPVKLLAGKVLGIGLAALLQASVVVAFALVLSKAVGSNLLHGTGPLEVVSTLVWLVLGYTFYCWVYAAAGSMAERQDQVQSLALPLSLPLIVGYVVSLTSASAASPSLLLKVFAYIPLTAPFAMTTMVGFGAVAWWQFALSVAITLISTVAVARLATGIYRRAILRTGSRVRLRDFRRSR
jgi:ABC-2 type transport system permease protein